jgi:hypothetical protein
MLTRTITIAGNPNITHTLYFDSRSNAEKKAERTELDTLVLKDDYGQTLSMHLDSVVITDLIQDGSEMLRAQGEGKIIEIKAQVKMQKRMENDAELKLMRDEAMRRQQVDQSFVEKNA